MENNTPEQKSLKQQQDELIIKHLEKFGQNNLFRASLDHFIETGMPSGSFYLSLCEMLSEHASQQNEALQKFKTYVHDRLDKMGIEKDPESVHKEAGCRIGGRLDIVEALQKRVQEYEQRYDNSIERNIDKRETIESLQKEVERLKEALKKIQQEVAYLSHGAARNVSGICLKALNP
jgi:hypothetical protein